MFTLSVKMETKNTRSKPALTCKLVIPMTKKQNLIYQSSHVLHFPKYHLKPKCIKIETSQQNKML